MDNDLLGTCQQVGLSGASAQLVLSSKCNIGRQILRQWLAVGGAIQFVCVQAQKGYIIEQRSDCACADGDSYHHSHN